MSDLGIFALLVAGVGAVAGYWCILIASPNRLTKFKQAMLFPYERK